MQKDCQYDSNKRFMDLINQLHDENTQLRMENIKFRRALGIETNFSPEQIKLNLISPEGFMMTKTSKRGRPRKNFQQTGLRLEQQKRAAYKPRTKGNARPLYFADEQAQTNPIVQDIRSKYLPPPGYVPTYQLQSPIIPRYFRTIDTPEDMYDKTEQITKKISIKLPARLNICDPSPLHQQPIEINQIVKQEKFQEAQ